MAPPREHMEKPGPHLVRNLTSKAWDSCLDIDRSKLRTADGVTYMLEFLEAKRRKLKVDMIGDALSSYFKRSEVSRRDGETWADYELRHENYIRNISKALTELKASPVPWEIFGWFLLHHYVGLEPSDVATVKSVTKTYKLEDIYATMRSLWSGDSLPVKDVERKRAKATNRVMIKEPNYDFDGKVYHEEPGLDRGGA